MTAEQSRADRQTGILADWNSSYICGQAHRQAEIQADRHTCSKAYRLRDIHTYR